MRKSTILAAGLLASLALVGAGSATAADAPAKPRFADQLAAKLGLTSEQLLAAIKAVKLDRIDAALAAGRITPEQAAKLKERVAAGKGLGLHLGKAGKLKQSLIAKSKRVKPVAEALGLTVEQLRTELKAGKSLAEIAATKGISKDQLVALLTKPAKERLAKAVTAGRITQARADELTTKLTERVAKLVERKRTPTA